MDQVNQLTVKFLCPPEMEHVLPRPIPAVRGLPDWFKALPQHCFSSVSNKELMTVKKCPPFIDAMTFGFLMPLVADLKVENGEFQLGQRNSRGWKFEKSNAFAHRLSRQRSSQRNSIF